MRGTGNGYEIVATGGSPYGPFSANLFVRTGGAPDGRYPPRAFRRHRFRRSCQPRRRPGRSPACLRPVRLRLYRHGSAGRGRRTSRRRRFLGARERRPDPVRTADPDPSARSYEARLVLYPQRAADSRRCAGGRGAPGSLLIARARARINYQGGRGTAALVADGESGARFHVAANADLSPGLYRIAAQGNVNGIAFRTAAPAEIRRSRAATSLARRSWCSPQGQVQLAGRYGPGCSFSPASTIST